MGKDKSKLIKIGCLPAVLAGLIICGNTELGFDIDKHSGSHHEHTPERSPRAEQTVAQVNSVATSGSMVFASLDDGVIKSVE